MPRYNLTPAEKRVLNLISRAKTNKEIAAKLGISPATVKRHLENVLRKLHLKNRVEAAIYALMMTGARAASIINAPSNSGTRELSMKLGRLADSHEHPIHATVVTFKF